MWVKETQLREKEEREEKGRREGWGVGGQETGNQYAKRFIVVISRLRDYG